MRAPQHEREGTFRIGQVALKQGESYTQRIRISEWYLFSKAGTYTITGELAPSGTSDSVGNAFALMITDLDLERLRMTCERLAYRALDSADLAAFDAAVDLGFVKDRLSVRYLERIAQAQSPAVRAAAIDGLGRIAVIAPLEATESLLVIMQRLDHEDRRRSAGVLDSIARTTENAEVRAVLVKAGFVRR